jgi:hypothetical protein
MSTNRGYEDIFKAYPFKMQLKVMVFWDVTPYILVDGYQRFGGTCCPGDGGSSETLVPIEYTTRQSQLRI